MEKMEEIRGWGEGKAHQKGHTQKVKKFQEVSQKSLLNSMFFL
jgi:hypothetical protein